jgi:hypothetical protein
MKDTYSSQLIDNDIYSNVRSYLFCRKSPNITSTTCFASRFIPSKIWCLQLVSLVAYPFIELYDYFQPIIAVNEIKGYVLLSLSFMGVLIVYFLIFFLIRRIIRFHRQRQINLANAVLNSSKREITIFCQIVLTKGYKYDEYGDRILNENVYRKELDRLLDKIVPNSSEYSDEVIDVLENTIWSMFWERAEELNNDFNDKKEITNYLAGYEFEYHVAKVFEKIGYVSHVTKASGDQGADVFISEGNKKIVVQAKFYSNPVGNKAVQEVNFCKRILFG